MNVLMECSHWTYFYYVIIYPRAVYTSQSYYSISSLSLGLLKQSNKYSSVWKVPEGILQWVGNWVRVNYKVPPNVRILQFPTQTTEMRSTSSWTSLPNKRKALSGRKQGWAVLGSEPACHVSSLTLLTGCVALEKLLPPAVPRFAHL